MARWGIALTGPLDKGKGGGKGTPPVPPLALLAILLCSVYLLGAASCPPRPPNPQPTPTPVPTPTPTPTPDPNAPVARDMLLRLPEGTTQTIDGQPVSIFQAIQCCMPFTVNSRMPRRPAAFKIKGEPVNSRWPAASREWMDFTRAYGANAYHFRLGPFYGDATHESEWADIGGPYLTKGGEFNEAFFAEIESLIAYAASKRAWVEVNPIDQWYCKHAASNWGDQEMPWQQSDIDACGKTWTAEHERYVRAWVKRLTKYGNVLWLLDNEGEEINGTQRAWYERYVEVVRDEESKHPSGFVHIIGAGLFYDVADYAVTHARTPLTAPIAGRWTLNNERSPSFSPNQEADNFKQARDRGLAWAFWRAEMSDAEMRETLGYFKAIVGGETPVGCFPPPGDDPNWGAATEGAGQRKDQVEQAKAIVGERCGAADKYEALDLIGAELRKMALCAGRDADAVLVLAEDGKWEEYHAVRFTDGCWSQDPAQMPKYRHEYLGTNPAPPACGEPTPPTVMEWKVVEHQKGPNRTIVDSTPLVGPASYCAAIGFTDGRSRCPVRQEGASDTDACNAVAVGAPFWSGNGMVSPENGYQYWVPRGTSGTVTVCASVAPHVCGAVAVTP